MHKGLRWEKGIFSGTYQIYSNNSLIGKLKNRAFSQSSVGEINGKEYTFRTKGFFKQYTVVVDNSNNSVVGEIAYNNWMTKASLSIQNRKAQWEYDNIWNTKWSIRDSGHISINYAGSFRKGFIDSNTSNDLLLLTGLYVTNYYQQMTLAILVAVLVPIWASTSN